VARGYSSDEVRRRVGVSYRQLDYWARAGIVSPSIAPAEGSGSRRRWAEIDVQRLMVAKLLREAGVSLEAIRRALGAPSHLAHLERSARKARELIESAA